MSFPHPDNPVARAAARARTALSWGVVCGCLVVLAAGYAGINLALFWALLTTLFAFEAAGLTWVWMVERHGRGPASAVVVIDVVEGRLRDRLVLDNGETLVCWKTRTPPAGTSGYAYGRPGLSGWAVVTAHGTYLAAYPQLRSGALNRDVTKPHASNLSPGGGAAVSQRANRPSIEALRAHRSGGAPVDPDAGDAYSTMPAPKAGP